MGKLTPGQMVTIKAIAPFEAAEAFALWSERMRAEVQSQGGDPDRPDDGVAVIVNDLVCGGLGPPWPLLGERPREFGERCAVALFTLIKEI